MRILLLVTRNAAGLQRRAQRTNMACVAFRPHMAAAQREPRSIMIETRLLPLSLHMTSFAFLSVPTIVNVLELVATDAGDGKIFIGFPNMAGDARNALM